MMVRIPLTATLVVVLAAVHADRFPWTDEVIFHQSGSNGAIEGVVHLVGEGIPSVTTVENTTDPEVCGRLHSLEDLVRVTNQRQEQVGATNTDVLGTICRPPGESAIH